MTDGTTASSLRDLLEIAITFGLIMLALWSPGPLPKLLGGGIFLWVVLTTWRSRQDATALGLKVRGLRQSLWIVWAALLIAGLMIFVAWRMHTLHAVLHGWAPLKFVVAYTLWALVQQFVLLDFFLLRALRLLPHTRAAVVVTAALFASAHIPNPLLMVATLVWAMVACALFLRYRNLYTIAVAHGILGICLAITVPNSVHHQMRVGIGYLHWHPLPPVQSTQPH